MTVSDPRDVTDGTVCAVCFTPDRVVPAGATMDDVRCVNGHAWTHDYGQLGDDEVAPAVTVADVPGMTDAALFDIFTDLAVADDSPLLAAVEAERFARLYAPSEDLVFHVTHRMGTSRFRFYGPFGAGVELAGMRFAGLADAELTVWSEL